MASTPDHLTSWVAPRLCDGLGNRLFQFAAAHQAAKRWAVPLVFAMPYCLPAAHGRWDSIFRLFPTVPKVWNPIQDMAASQDSGTAFDHNPLPAAAPAKKVLLKGAWIAAGYVEPDIYPAWNAAISDKDELLARWNLSTAEAREATVFLHVRLGDYLKLPHHQVSLQAYYAKAIASFDSEIRFYVFSDDLERAKQVLSFLSDVTVTWVDEPDELKTLFLMSSCWRGAITANSTFSWWGAYFGRQADPEGHRTLMPSRWMASGESTADVYPSWATKIEV